MSKRLLISFAHPDDESFGLGSFIAKCTAEGTEVYLICATNGDVGTVLPGTMKEHATVADLRLAELDCAAKVLNIKEVITFGYRDSGMMNSELNKHPQCLWAAPMDEVTAKVTEVIQRIQPQVVITFNKFGGYGHPDHIKISQATVLAFNTLQGQPNAPQRLYFHAMPILPIRVGINLMRLTGKNPRRMGANQDLDFVAVVEGAEPVHAKINVARYLDQGAEASACHASQLTIRNAFPLAKLWMRQLNKYSSFTRVAPPPQRGQRVESDLFAGITPT